MKIKILILILLGAILQSCYKPGDIQVKNKISNVKLNNIKWGNIYIGTDLLPGESSSIVTVRKFDEKLPASHIVRFEMTANNQTVYLETKESYSLDEGGELLIELDDDTKVNNAAEK